MDHACPTETLAKAGPARPATAGASGGHRDGVSNFTVYQGLLVGAIRVARRYDLLRPEDLERLALAGLFDRSRVPFMHPYNGDRYRKWLSGRGYVEPLRRLVERLEGSRSEDRP